MVGLTALQNLVKAGLGERNVGEGRHLLVHAGAGGVGNWAIQLGKIAGARVSTTCSPKNNEFCRSLGADHCVDYTSARFEEELGAMAADSGMPPVDTAFDLMGGDYELRTLKMLPSAGHYLNIMNSGWATKLGGMVGQMVGFAFAAYQYFVAQHLVGPHYHFTIVEPSGAQLGLLAEYLSSGECVAPVDSVVPLAELASGHDRVAAEHSRGKVVVEVAGEVGAGRARL